MIRLRYFLFCFLVFTRVSLPGQTVDFQSSNLPIVLINTNNQSIHDEPKITATLQIIDNGPGKRNNLNDLANDYNGLMGIELRGSSSLQVYEKKAYDIELRDDAGNDKNASLLGMPKESDWALIAPLNDKTLMRDMLAYKLAAEIMEWAPRTRYVEVVLNGQYEGVYMLIETIKRDKNRVPIRKMDLDDLAGDSLTGGYILSMDKVNNGVGGDFVSKYPPVPGAWQQTWFQIVYPRPANVQPTQRAYIQGFMDDFERKLYNWDPNAQAGAPPYEDWLEPQSWVDYLLVNELSKNIDGYRLSAFFYKNADSEDPRVRMGPVWDFNISFGIGDYCGGQTIDGWVKDFDQYCGDDSWIIHFWWPKICRDYAFQQRVIARWAALRSGPWSDTNLKNCIDSTAALLNEAQGRNFQRWPVLGIYVWPNAYVGYSYADEINYLKKWALQRAAWMDKNIQSIGPYDYRHFPYIDNATVFPNPVRAGAGLTLRYTTKDSEPLDFLLFDAFGRQAMPPMPLPTGKWIRHTVTQPITLPAGIYIYRIEQDGSAIKTGKLIIEN